MSSYTIKAFRSKSTPDVYFLNTAVSVLQFIYVYVYDEMFTSYGRKVNQYTLTLDSGDTNTSTTNRLVVVATIPGYHGCKLTVSYSDGAVEEFAINQKVRVYANWPQYDYSIYRVLNNSFITLPYSFEDISIKPNEFGVADVVNASLTKLNACVTYIRAQTKALSNTTPTEYLGWLGCHSTYRSRGVIWHTSNNTPDLSADYQNATVPANLPEYNDLLDMCVVGSEMYILSRGEGSNNINLMVDSIKNDYTPIVFETLKTSLGNIKSATSISVQLLDTHRRAIFLSDNIGNKIYKIIVDLNDTDPTLAVEQSIGGFGVRQEPTKFYSVSEVGFFNNSVYAVDYNNKCIKVMNTDLGWLKTFYKDDFETNPVVSIAVTPPAFLNADGLYTAMNFILTETRKLYVLEDSGDYFNTNTPYYDLVSIPSTETPRKVIVDYGSDFVYILCDTAVHKYSITGLYIGTMSSIPVEDLRSIATDTYRNVYVVGSNKIHKVLDVIESHNIASRELDSNYFTSSEITIDEEEMVQDWVVNRALQRVSTNIDLLYRSIHSKFGVSKVNTKYGMQARFNVIPVSKLHEPACELRDKIGVGTNEISMSQVYNRDIFTLYTCLLSLLDRVQTSLSSPLNNQGECRDVFCWSWKSTQCKDIVDPFMRICDINPITFNELKNKSKGGYPIQEKRWYQAYSACCIGDRPEKPVVEVSTYSGQQYLRNQKYESIKDSTLLDTKYFAPYGVAINNISGIIYVSDSGSHTLRVLWRNNTVTTYAGKANTSGNVDGNRTDARFNAIQDISVDDGNNVYISDYLNNKVRKLSYTGVVSTIIPSLNSPTSILVTEYNLYVGSFTDNKLYKYDLTGVLQEEYNIQKPLGITKDTEDNIYVTSASHIVYKISTSATVTVYAGDGSSGNKDGDRSVARFNTPYGIASDIYNNLYITDTYNHNIRRIDKDGKVTTIAGAGIMGYADGYKDISMFNIPTGIAYSMSDQALYITDLGNNVIRKASILTYD